MPYIEPERRRRFDEHIDAIVEQLATPGDLTFVLYAIAVRRMRALADGMTRTVPYAQRSMIRASLADAETEFYLRQMDSYELRKRAKYGDV